MKNDTTRLSRQLSRELARLYPDEAATRLERLAHEEARRFLEELPATEAAEILGRMTPHAAARVTRRMEAAAVGILEALPAPTAARILSVLDEDVRDELLGRLPDVSAKELRQLLSYPPQTAGALMDPEVLALRPEQTAHDALERLRALRHKRIHRIFLVSADHRLLGSVPIRDLAVADPTTPLGRLLVRKPPGVPATASQAELLEVLSRVGTVNLPVVDFEGRLVGVLRHDALVEATREEATADMQSMFGAGKEERALSKVSFAVRKRLPWLEVNLGTAFLAASVVGLFEATIARFTALAVLLPVVAGQSGNTGAQALAVTMRGLTLREIRTRQWLRVCLKEVNVGFINGVAVALTTGAAVYLWSRSLGMALVILISMVISMVAAGLSGAAIPLLLTAARQDPAQSSSIILTTITDVVGFFSFLGIATLLSGML